MHIDVTYAVLAKGQPCQCMPASQHTNPEKHYQPNHDLKEEWKKLLKQTFDKGINSLLWYS